MNLTRRENETGAEEGHFLEHGAAGPVAGKHLLQPAADQQAQAANKRVGRRTPQHEERCLSYFGSAALIRHVFDGEAA